MTSSTRPQSLFSESTASRSVFMLGILALGVAVFASGTLAFEHLSGIAIPGCGAGSPCARLASSQWGKVPGIHWPVSFAGLAYFSGLLAAWIVTRGMLRPWMRWGVTAGALASAAFIGIMLGMGKNSLCPYCLAAHISNFAFLGLVGLTPRPEFPAARPLRAPAAAIMTLILVTVGLALADTRTRDAAQKQDESDFAAAQEEIFKATQAQQASAKPTPPAPQPAPPPTPQPVTQPVSQPPPAPAQARTQPEVLPAPGLFTGRYRFGPEQSPVRVVMFTDYQCPDCKLMEGQVEQLLAKYPDISISIKHFPFCIDCNRHIGAQANFHPNACWAARAAEAAGMLYGPEGFKKMHFWLFNRGGSFTAEELDTGLAELGFEARSFIATMTGPETLKRVQADIDEAISYGLMTTPFIYVNGAELKGWRSPDALVRMVEAVYATRPSPLGPDADRPLRAADSFVQAWRDQVAMGWPMRKQPWNTSPTNAPVRVTLFGDLQEPYCAEADKIIRDFTLGRQDVFYEFRYFPFDQACNPTLPNTKFPLGCRAARAAEAAGQLGGAEAYWRMHEWLMTNQKSFSDDAAKAHAGTIGLDPAAFIAKMNSPEVAQVVAGDADIGKRMQIQEIPRIFVNGKLIPRWKTPGGFVIERIIEEAGEKKPEAPRAAPQIPQIPGVNAPIGSP